MLPIYQAKSFVRIIEQGGHTKPWVVVVNTNDGLKEFVVKLYKTDAVDNDNTVCNEVLGSVLASQFDLVTPSPALIDFSPDFVNTLNSIPYEILEDRDDRIKFGCESIAGPQPYDIGLPSHVLNRYMELDTIFGFDALIRNRDRNDQKPNLFISNRTTYLIDHERAFERMSIGLGEFKAENLNRFWMQYHLCRDRLTKLPKSEHPHFFETFREYLRNLNVGILNGYVKQLKNEGHACSDYEMILEWLILAKEKSPIFINYLKESIA